MELSDEILGELAALAGVALAHNDLTEALRDICQIADRAVLKAEGATLTTFTPAGPVVAAASNEWAGQLDELQYVEHEGRTRTSLRARVTSRLHYVFGGSSSCTQHTTPRW